MDKVVASAAAAVADVPDGATVLLGGFGVIQGWAASLLVALAARGSRALELVASTPGVGPYSPQLLAEHGDRLAQSVGRAIEVAGVCARGARIVNVPATSAAARASMTARIE